MPPSFARRCDAFGHLPYVRGIPPAPIKAQISFRIDADVPAWLKSKGEGHLSRVNTILREHMMAEGKRGG